VYYSLELSMVTKQSRDQEHSLSITGSAGKALLQNNMYKKTPLALAQEQNL